MDGRRGDRVAFERAPPGLPSLEWRYWRSDIPTSPTIHLTLAEQLKRMMDAGINEEKAKHRLKRALTHRLSVSPAFGGGDEHFINWQTGRVTSYNPRDRVKGTDFTPTLQAHEFFAALRPGGPLFDVADPYTPAGFGSEGSDARLTGRTGLRTFARGELNVSVSAELEAFVADATPNLLVTREGLIDLAPTEATDEVLAAHIESARALISGLIAVCRQGNQQHAVLADYAEQYRAQLDKLGASTSGVQWFVIAQKIELYRCHYVASSHLQPGEYPPLDPGISTEIDTVILATGILARQFPEIAKSQDDFEKYAGRQIGVRRSQSDLMSAVLVAAADAATPRAAAVVKASGELDPGATPEEAPEASRAAATKAGLVRGILPQSRRQPWNRPERSWARLPSTLPIRTFLHS